MSELVAKLRAAIDEFERDADEFHYEECDKVSRWKDYPDTCDCGEPERRRRMAKAHREILDEHERIPDDGINFTFAERDRATDTIKALAMGYGVEC